MYFLNVIHNADILAPCLLKNMELLLLIAIVAIVVFRYFLSAGTKGELAVSLFLWKNQQDKKYVINDVIIVNEGKSSQIDHLVINRSGIFVIETKNYAGRIYGSENQKMWTQVLNYGKNKYQLYNPIFQNKTHIKTLSGIVGRDDCFISIIVFPKAELMTDMGEEVGGIFDMKRRYRQQTQEIFSIVEMNDIYQKLLEFKNNPQITKSEHIQNIKQMKKNIDNNICPRCGKTLVQRKSQYGYFYGCSGYPSCKFKKN